MSRLFHLLMYGLIMLSVLAAQMIAGRTEPKFPNAIISRALPTRYLLRLGDIAIPILTYVENVIHPRWPTFFRSTKRISGVVVLLLTAVLLLTPVPLSNIGPAILIALIAIAYVEEDGLSLFGALLVAVVFIAATLIAVGGAISAAIFIPHPW